MKLKTADFGRIHYQPPDMELDLLIDDLTNPKAPTRLLAWDTETDGGPLQSGRVRMVSLSDSSDTWVIPGHHPQLAELVTRVLWRADVTVFHNAAFDLPWLWHVADQVLLPPKGQAMFDTMLWAQWYRDVYGNGKAGLKELATRCLGIDGHGPEKALRAWAKAQGWRDRRDNWWARYPCDEPAYIVYSGADAAMTAALGSMWAFDPLDKGVRLEFATALRYCRMRWKGMRIDTERASALHDELSAERERLGKLIKPYGIDNVNSTVQIGNALEDWVTAKTASGRVATDTETLEDVDHPLADLVLQWRKADKMRSTWVRPMHGESRVHPGVKPSGAVTGRVSMHDPPVNQFPKVNKLTYEPDWRVRRCIRAERGHRIVTVDFSQQEVRKLAELSGEPRLVDAFERGEDIHSVMADAIFGEGFSPEQRQQSKHTVFAIIYGGGPRAVARNARLDLDYASKLIRDWKRANPVAKRWMDAVNRQAERDKWTELPSGRRIPIQPGKDGRMRYYAAVNYRIQGGCAHMLKLAMKRLDKAGLWQWAFCTQHDEVDFSFPKERAAELGEEARRTMSMRFGGMRYPCEATYHGKHWDDPKEGR